MLSKKSIKDKIWKVYFQIKKHTNPSDVLCLISRILVVKKLSEQIENATNCFKLHPLETLKTKFLEILHLIETVTPSLTSALLTHNLKTTLNSVEDHDLFTAITDLDLNLAYKNLENPFALGDAFKDFINLIRSEDRYKGSFYITPGDIASLLINLLHPEDGMTLYDPALGTGGFLIEAFKYLRLQNKVSPQISLFGQEINSEIYALAKINLFLNHIDNCTVKLGDTLRNPKFVNKKKLQTFDLVIADPPWSMPNWGRDHLLRNDNYNILQFGVPPDNCADWTWIQHTIASLNERGRGAIILSRGILYRESEKKIRTAVVQADLLEAVILLPSNMFYNTYLAAVILIVNKKKPDHLKGHIFFLTIESDEKKQNNKNSISIENLNQILSIYNKKKEHNFISALVNTKRVEEYGFNLNPLLYVNDISQIASKRGYKPFRMKDIVIEIKDLTKIDEGKFENKSNCIFFPKHTMLSVCNSRKKCTAKLSNYYRIKFNPNLVFSDFVAAFFNQDLGRMIWEQFYIGTEKPRISMHILMQTTVYLPTIDVQKDIMESIINIQEISIQLDEFNRDLWKYPMKAEKIKKQIAKYNREDSLNDWIESLPFPLATILRRYITDIEEKKKVAHLLNFFEASAVIFGTIMLSALYSDRELFNRKKKSIFSDQDGRLIPLDRSYFGVWVLCCKRLAKEFRRDFNDNFDQTRNLFHINSREFYSMLFNKKLYNIILADCNIRRNEWKGHPPINSKSKTKVHLDYLIKQLNSFRAVIKFAFEEVSLIMPEDEYMIINELRHQKVKFFTGSNISSDRKLLPLTKDLIPDRLYLIQNNQRVALELIPFFQFHTSQEDPIACYFYDKIEGNLIHWHSYHFINLPEDDWENPRLMDFIAALRE